MNQLDAMRVFVAVVENHGFTAAARVLRMPLPTVCRKVAELEDHLGAQLLTRSTRKVSVTDSGECYFDDVNAYWKMWRMLHNRPQESSNV